VLQNRGVQGDFNLRVDGQGQLHDPVEAADPPGDSSYEKSPATNVTAKGRRDPREEPPTDDERAERRSYSIT